MMAALALAVAAHPTPPPTSPSRSEVKQAMYSRYEGEAMAGRQQMQAAYPDQIVSVHVTKIGKLRRLRCEPGALGAPVRCSFEVHYRNHTDRFKAALKYQDNSWAMIDLAPAAPVP